MIARVPVLLIVTCQADPHADEVIRILGERQTLTLIRVNSDDFLTNCRYTFGWDLHGTSVRSELSVLGSNVTADKFDVAWWRKPAELHPSPDLTHPEAARIAIEEGDELLRSITAPFPDLRWVNRPQAMNASSRKLQQIHVAKSLGLSIPETLVTNVGSEIMDFVRKHRRCIIKPLRAAGFGLEGKQWGLYTARITEEAVEELLDSAHYAPVMVQREIEKHVELRITIIGNTVFACQIGSAHIEHEDVRTDWRVIEPAQLHHEMVSIPGSLGDALLGMLKHYNLNYGAFDVIQEPDGRYYFLELNPNGQYLWIELLTGAPLSSAMADFIEELARGGTSA